MKLLKGKRGNLTVGGVILTVIGIVISVTVVPTAIIRIKASEGNYTAGDYALLILVPTVLVIGILLTALKGAGVKVKM